MKCKFFIRAESAGRFQLQRHINKSWEKQRKRPAGQPQGMRVCQCEVLSILSVSVCVIGFGFGENSLHL